MQKPKYIEMVVGERHSYGRRILIQVGEIFSMTAGAWMLAITLTMPAPLLHGWMSMVVMASPGQTSSASREVNKLHKRLFYEVDRC